LLLSPIGGLDLDAEAVAAEYVVSLPCPRGLACHVPAPKEPGELLDKAALEKALAAAGIPAVVIFGGSCLFKDFGRASEPSRKLTGDPRTWVKDLAIGHFLTLYRAGIPSGDDVVIEMSYGADGKKSGPVFGFRLALLPQGTALSCPDSAKLGTVR
jgi:hypothetical protein